MTGFSPQWLALREPVDHRSRDASLLSDLQHHFAGRPRLSITDLGCGTGSNLRALAPHLGPEQHWQLVDYDPILLQSARDALAAWADHTAVCSDGSLDLDLGGRRLVVSFRQADLNRDLESVLDQPTDLVTAAAFFDLVSVEWIATFVDACVSRQHPFYTVLTYDGRETWEPPHPADEDVLSAFHSHQGHDKGFGKAAGPAATQALQLAFRKSGWSVTTARSPWQLTRQDAALMEALARGAAAAVAETGRVDPSVLASWLAARSVAQTSEIGHLDLFAHP